MIISMNPNVSFCPRSSDIICDRKRQIDTVKVFNDKLSERFLRVRILIILTVDYCHLSSFSHFRVSEISQNEQYSVEFTAGGNKLAMLIILGPDFPMDKPLLKITPSISHQWVNENSEIVKAPGYLNVSS